MGPWDSGRSSQGCVTNSFMEGRFSGSFWRHWFTNWVANTDSFAFVSPKSCSSYKIACLIADFDLPKNGGFPVSSTNATTPTLQTSTLSVYYCSLTSSGAIYSGLPSACLRPVEGSKKLANPKSVNFRVNSPFSPL